MVACWLLGGSVSGLCVMCVHADKPSRAAWAVQPLDELMLISRAC
jgi:hypothetical protein